MAIKKVVVIGPESTGKSTLSEALAAAYDTVWVPEYAREYLDRIQRPYRETDLLEIAARQVASEDALLSRAKDVLICDTDLYVLKVWSEHSYDRCHKWILEQIAVRRYDLYLLTYTDINWEEGPYREHGSQQERSYFYNQYRDIVMNSHTPWADIRGTHEERVELAKKVINALNSKS